MSGAAFLNNRGEFVKIKNQLLLTHGILVALALTIVFINIFTYKDMENDANIINQAGKLRMLSYNMASFSMSLYVKILIKTMVSARATKIPCVNNN